MPPPSPIDACGPPGLPPYICPGPAPFEASQTAILIFFLFAGAAAVLAALPWALYAGIKRQNWIPLLIICSGFLCSLLEPMLDTLGHLQWASNLPVAFTNFGIDIPLLIPPCYAAFLGLESYFCYYLFRKGITVKQTFWAFAIGGITDAIMETVGINLGNYHYYGVQPYTAFGFPYWWGFINGASFVTIGFALWYLVPRLKGAQRLWLLLLSPCGMMAAYFITGWPHILALNSTLPVWAKWVATTIMMAMILGYIRGLAYFAAVSEPVHNWTFMRMFFYRTMTRSARDKLDAKMLVRPSQDMASTSAS